MTLGLAVSALALAACSEKKSETPETAQTAPTEAAAPAANTSAAAPAAAGKPAPDNVDTVSGAKFADFTGDAAKGEKEFAVCKTCHAVEAGVNKIGPSLNKLVGRAAGTVAGYSYSPANKNSGITWSQEKLFQYLENPQRVVPGTKMAFAGIPDAQKRADVIAYLASQ
ncbi:c-type cytochrome [Sphingobium algorifonticola]|uniref:Cytochrome c family protein n=1 Tax=Sphingobium algorifonticola TaxID=2008318 RepID=A0A437J5X7_9SPHN|nr:cytochrome c family protein [Sphingobium algorifonticola]RVT40204.1 cytochrome c family protein [Sphingobium algorifonticola]